MSHFPILIVVSDLYDPMRIPSRELERQGGVVVKSVGQSLMGNRFSAILISHNALEMRELESWKRWFEEELPLHVDDPIKLRTPPAVAMHRARNP